MDAFPHDPRNHKPRCRSNRRIAFARNLLRCDGPRHLSPDRRGPKAMNAHTTMDKFMRLHAPLNGDKRNWSPEAVALVERLHRQGRTYSQIACNLGVGKGAISGLFRTRIKGETLASLDVLQWRIKQLLLSDYSCRDAAEICNCDVSVAYEVFDEIWEIEE